VHVPTEVVAGPWSLLNRGRRIGDLNVAGNDFHLGNVWGVVPSSLWATMTYPIKAIRILDTPS
jgi:hypothetical protein